MRAAIVGTAQMKESARRRIENMLYVPPTKLVHGRARSCVPFRPVVLTADYNTGVGIIIILLSTYYTRCISKAVRTGHLGSCNSIYACVLKLHPTNTTDMTNSGSCIQIQDDSFDRGDRNAWWPELWRRGS